MDPSMRFGTVELCGAYMMIYAQVLTYSHCPALVGLSWQTQGLSHSVQFSSVAQPYLTLCDPMDCSTPCFPVHHQLPELT